MRRSLFVAWSIALATLNACGGLNPSPTAILLETPSGRPGDVSPTASVAVEPSATPTVTPPTVTPAPSPSVAPSREPVPLDLDIREISTRYTKHLGDIRSLGNEIVWTSEGDVWRYTPPDGEPERIYRGDPDEPIGQVTGAASGYLFWTREAIRGFSQPNRWKLWFLPAANEEPVLIDFSDNEGLPSPTMTIDSRYIVWTAFHGEGEQAINELRLVELDELDSPTVLISYPAYDESIWFPSIQGNELWYGVSRNDWDAGTVHPRVEMLDLTNPNAAPTIYGADVRAFMPAVNDRVVVWKGGGEDDLAALSAGQLFVHRRETGVTEPQFVPDRSWDRIAYPSVGDRFVAWSDEIATHFYIYDLELRQMRKVIEYDRLGPELIRWPSVAGNLLVFVYIRDEESRHQIRWAYLPG